MQTVLVDIRINGEVLGYCRALCDSGAEGNLVHQQLIQPWYKYSQEVNGIVTGLGDQDVPIKRQIEIEIRPWFDSDQVLYVQLWVLPKSLKWGPTYPELLVNCFAMQRPLTAPLVDPLFWNPSRIQLLFGIEVMAALTNNGQTHRIARNLVSQTTTMGNIVYGSVGDQSSSQCSQFNEKRLVQVLNLHELDKSLQKFWQFEDLVLCTKKDAEKELLDELFAKTQYRVWQTCRGTPNESSSKRAWQLTRSRIASISNAGAEVRQ